MLEAYEVGISLALQDGVSDGIALIRRDLAALDRAIAATSQNLAQSTGAVGCGGCGTATIAEPGQACDPAGRACGSCTGSGSCIEAPPAPAPSPAATTDNAASGQIVSVPPPPAALAPGAPAPARPLPAGAAAIAPAGQQAARPPAAPSPVVVVTKAVAGAPQATGLPAMPSVTADRTAGAPTAPPSPPAIPVVMVAPVPGPPVVRPTSPVGPTGIGPCGAAAAQTTATVRRPRHDAACPATPPPCPCPPRWLQRAPLSRGVRRVAPQVAPTPIVGCCPGSPRRCRTATTGVPGFATDRRHGHKGGGAVSRAVALPRPDESASSSRSATDGLVCAATAAETDRDHAGRHRARWRASWALDDQ